MLIKNKFLQKKAQCLINFQVKFEYEILSFQ